MVSLLHVHGSPHPRKEVTYGIKPSELMSGVCWEYKWEDKPDAEVFGPYPTNNMIAWCEQVRRASSYVFYIQLNNMCPGLL